MISNDELTAKMAPAMATCAHDQVPAAWDNGVLLRSAQRCGDEAHAPTRQWCEPLCKAHYDEALRRPPRTELRFSDGHREVRNNFVYGEIYKDVETEFDGETGNVLPVKTVWFEREEVYRDESGKVVMLFFRQIDDPTPAQVKRVNSLIKKPAEPSWLGRWVNRIKLWFAMRGVG